MCRRECKPNNFEDVKGRFCAAGERDVAWPDSPIKRRYQFHLTNQLRVPLHFSHDISDEERALLTSPRALPSPLSRRSILVVVSACLAVVSVWALISRWLVQYSPEWRWIWTWGHPLSMLTLLGGLILVLLRQENRRRQRAQKRLAIVAECNHHIRNSLQAIVLGEEEPENDWLVIAQAVEQIEQVLAEVLPEAVDAPTEILSVSIRPCPSRMK
jgi:hypothetical protein